MDIERHVLVDDSWTVSADALTAQLDSAPTEAWRTEFERLEAASDELGEVRAAGWGAATIEGDQVSVPRLDPRAKRDVCLSVLASRIDQVNTIFAGSP